MHLIVWTASGQRYAVETRSIVEVAPAVEARPVAGAPAWIRGLIDYRGALVPLLDVRALLGGRETDVRRASRILVLRTADGMIGLLVETVESVERGEEGEAHPGFAVAETPYLGPIVRTARGPVQVVRPEHLLRDEHREILFSRAAGEGA